MKASKILYYISGMIFVLSILMIILAFVLKVENFKTIKIIKIGEKSSYFLIKKQDIYDISLANSITLKINNEYFEVFIKKFEFHSNMNFLKVYINGLDFWILDNTEISANIVKGYKTIGSFLFS